MIQVINFLVNHLFVKLWDILLLNISSSGVDKGFVRRNQDFFLVRTSVLSVYKR